MGSAAYGANLVNAVEGLKARGDLAPYAHSLNKSGAVSGQWLISTPEGTVAVLKAGSDGTVYLAMTLEPEMAAAQAWVCNPPKPPHRSNNNRTFSQGGSHDLRRHPWCICSPNPWDESNRDCPVHRPGSMPWGIDPQKSTEGATKMASNTTNHKEETNGKNEEKTQENNKQTMLAVKGRLTLKNKPVDLEVGVDLLEYHRANAEALHRLSTEDETNPSRLPTQGPHRRGLHAPEQILAASPRPHRSRSRSSSDHKQPWLVDAG